MLKAKMWRGSKPVKCDLCGRPFEHEFVDGFVVRLGSWGLLCIDCHRTHGCGFGTGRGQRYDLKTLVKLEG